jgi:leucyl aminopeptidase
MRVLVEPASVRLALDPAPAISTDFLVIPFFEDRDADGLPAGADEASGGEILRAVSSREASGHLYDLFVTPVTRDWRARRIVLAGAGRRAAFDLERLRKLAAASAVMARKRRGGRIAFLAPALSGTHAFTAAEAAQAVAEGLSLSAFAGDLYKTGERVPPPLRELVVVADGPATAAAALENAVSRGSVMGDSCNLARALCNEPSNVLTPRVFAQRASEIAADAGLGVNVLDEQAIAGLKMGLLLGVARGSAEPPRVLVLEYTPPHAPAAPVLGLVGKGITFDTGGISIKPADGMERMKDDMAGGAAVVCAMRAIALLRAPVKVVGVVPMTENMPGGRAIKPGDVLTGAGGKTVEVINTDAEGRLVLGDGLWYAQQLGATHLVDVATLTGACVVALGKVVSGVFGQPDEWRELVVRTANKAGDRAWPMPIYDEYADQLKSEIADVMNSGGRPAGACTAAMFLKKFTNELPWAHIDIAGTAWAEEVQPFQPKGPTGVAVRTLAELAFALGSGR